MPVVDDAENLMKLRAVHSFIVAHKTQFAKLPSSLGEIERNLKDIDDEGAFRCAKFYRSPENNKFEEWLMATQNSKGYLVTSRFYTWEGRHLIYVLFDNGTARRMLVMDFEKQ